MVGMTYAVLLFRGALHKICKQCKTLFLVMFRLALRPVYTCWAEPATYATVKLIGQSTVNIDALNTWLPLHASSPRGPKPVWDRSTWRPKFNLLNHNTQNCVTSLTVRCFHVLPQIDMFGVKWVLLYVHVHQASGSCWSTLANKCLT